MNTDDPGEIRDLEQADGTIKNEQTIVVALCATFDTVVGPFSRD